MSPEEAHCFELLDAYARSGHGYFLAEFFLKEGRDGSYLCCFRPTTSRVDISDIYASRYVTIDADHVRSISANQAMPNRLVQQLDDEFTK